MCPAGGLRGWEPTKTDPQPTLGPPAPQPGACHSFYFLGYTWLSMLPRGPGSRACEWFSHSLGVAPKILARRSRHPRGHRASPEPCARGYEVTMHSHLISTPHSEPGAPGAAESALQRENQGLGRCISWTVRCQGRVVSVHSIHQDASSSKAGALRPAGSRGRESGNAGRGWPHRTIQQIPPWPEDRREVARATG